MKKSPQRKADATIDPEQVALTWFKANYYPKGCPVPLDDIREMILHVALAHPEQVGQWLTDFARYRDAEGFTGSGVADLMAATIVQQPQYKGTRRKLESGAR